MRTLIAATVLATSVISGPVLAQSAMNLPARASPESGPLSDVTVRTRADALLAQMTPEEKAGQLSQYFYFQIFPPMNKPILQSIEAGGVGSLLFVVDPAEVNRLQKLAVEKSRLKIPLLFGFDVIHGMRTIFPVPVGMAASWDPPMVEQAQSIAASEARASGVHWAFAPMVDIARDPRWGRMVEGAGEDPYLGSTMAAAQVRGFQGPYIGSPGHIIAGPKHFAGYGASLGGRDYDEVNLSDNELWNVYLPPFKAAIDAGAGNIMSAYMSLNGVPATGNAWLLTHVLRDTWGFKGFVVSDASAVLSLVTQGFAANSEDAAVRALKAGVDMEMTPPMKQPAMATLPDALKVGKITAAEIDNAVRLVLEAKIRMGLFEHPYVDPQQALKIVHSQTRSSTTARTGTPRGSPPNAQPCCYATTADFYPSIAEPSSPWRSLDHSPMPRGISLVLGCSRRTRQSASACWQDFAMPWARRPESTTPKGYACRPAPSHLRLRCSTKSRN